MLLRNWFENLKTSYGLNLLRQSRRRSPLRKRDFSLCFQAAEVMEERLLLSAGALDPTFGSGGVATPSASINGGPAAIAVYSNAQGPTAGDIVAAGGITTWTGNKSTGSFAVVRYMPNGTPDSSFGSSGEVTTSFGKSYGNSSAYAVAIQGDGKVIAAGFAAGSNTGPSMDFALARYNVNGSLDSTFGSGGKVTTNFSGGTTATTGSTDDARAAFIQPDGKIVLAGETIAINATGFDIALARYNADGTLDTAFGSGGKVTTSHTLISGSSYAKVKDAALQADGKILVGGYTFSSSTSFAGFVARYNSNGTLDATFGSGGFVVLPGRVGPTASVGHLAIEPSGEIVVTSIGQLALLHSDGSFDTSFGNPAIVSNGAVALEPNGDIVVGGGNNNQFVSRFLPNGTADTTFGSGGVVTLSSYFTALAIQPDGKIDLAGNGFIVDRLLPGAPQIGSPTPSANSVPVGSNVTLTASNITDANPGASITQVAIYVENANGTNTLLGYGTESQSSPGTWTFTFSTAGWTTGTHTLFAQAKDSYGVFGDPFTITETLI